jgi:hypothetical protein
MLRSHRRRSIIDNAVATSPIEHFLAILGALVPLASALASYINHIVRTKQAAGEAVNPLLLTGGSLLNVAAPVEEKKAE